MGWRKRAVIALGVASAGLVMTTAPVRADVVDPEGACSATGVWLKEDVKRSSADFSPDDVIVIPQKDTVQWSGNIAGYELGSEGPRREISGEVKIDVAGLFSIPVDDWSGSSVRYANSGEHEYTAPKTLIGVKIKLKGEHREAALGTADFTKVCSGSVYLKVDGGTFANPITLGSLLLAGLTGGLLFRSGVVKKKWAYEDRNQG